MSLLRLTTGGLSLLLMATATGCFGGGESRGRTARFNLGSDDNAKQARGRGDDGRRNIMASRDDGGVTTPEASVQKELERLREREKKQARYVKELKDSLNKDFTLAQKEEEKLVEMQKSIAQFESAQQRYQQAMALERERNGEYRGGGMTIRTAGYEEDDYPNDRRQAGYEQGYQPARGEEVLYRQPAGPDPRYDNRRAPDPRSQAAQLPPAAPALSNQGYYADDAIVWDPPANLFSQSVGSSSQQSRQAQSAPVQRSVQNMPDPARSRPAERQAQPQVQPQQQSIRPAAPAPAARATQADSFGQEGMDDDVFTPDLFLSGGK